MDENIDIEEPDGVSVLTLRSLRSTDGGVYECTVFNIYGRATASALIRVIRKYTPFDFGSL